MILLLWLSCAFTYYVCDIGRPDWLRIISYFISLACYAVANIQYRNLKERIKNLEARL